VHRVLRPGGTFVLANMIRFGRARDFPVVVDDLVRKSASAARLQRRRLPSFAARTLSRLELQRLLRRNGFTIQRFDVRRGVRTPTSGADFVAFLQRSMKDFYWADLATRDASRLRRAIATELDQRLANTALEIPSFNAVIVAQRR
jgi:hypothetical protein